MRDSYVLNAELSYTISIACPAQKILTEMAKKAKGIIRTGAFDLGDNVLLYSGVDVPKWFAKFTPKSRNTMLNE